MDPIHLHTERGQRIVLGGEILGISRAAGISPMSIPATGILFRLGRRHRALLRAGVMGLSAVSSAGVFQAFALRRRTSRRRFGLCETLPTSSGVAQGCRLAW